MSCLCFCRCAKQLTKPWATAVFDHVPCCHGMWDHAMGPNRTSAQGAQGSGCPVPPWLALSGPVHDQTQQGCCFAAVQKAHQQVILEPALA